MNRFSLCICAGALLLLSLATASCNETENCMIEESVENVSFVIAPPQFFDDGAPGTKSYYDITSNEYLWNATDTLGIYPDTGSQVYFVIGQDGADKHDAVFDGGGWAFKSSSRYYSYFPFQGDFYLDRHCIPVSYLGQKQSGKTSVKHVSPYMFSYTDPTSASSGSLYFTYRMLGAVVMPVISNVTGSFVKLTLEAEDDLFIQKGHYDLMATEPSIVADELSNTLSIGLEDFSLSSGETATVYMMCGPAALRGKKLLIKLEDQEGGIWTCTKASISSDYTKNSIRKLTCNSWANPSQDSGSQLERGVEGEGQNW